MERFVEAFRRSLKVIADKSKVMMLGVVGLECEILVDGAPLKQVSEFKYLGCFERIGYKC